MRRWSVLLALTAATMCLQSVAAEPVKVWDVPDVGWSRGKDYYPIACLEAALIGMEKDVSYHELMVASGAAFRIAWRPGAYDAGAKILYGYDPIVEAAPAAGVRAEVVTAPDAEAAWDIITESIDRGAPVISWAEDGLQVICGYDADTRNILCRTWDVDAEEYVQRPVSSARVAGYGAFPGRRAEAAPAYELWVLHEEGEPPQELDWPAVLRRALQMSRRPAYDRLHGRYVCGLAAYQAWAETLRNREAHNGFPNAGLQTVSTALNFAEGREAAAEVLQQRTYVHDAFARAAQAYRSEAAEFRGTQWVLCRNRQAPWAERMEMFNENIKDEAIREEAARLIERALAYERAALAALTTAFEDLAPEEMVAEVAQPEAAVGEAAEPAAAQEEDEEETAAEPEEAAPPAEEAPTEAAPAEETEGAPPEETEAAPAEETEEPEAQQGQEAEPEGPTADELVAEGLAAKRAGRLDEAAERLRQALEIDAEHVQAHWVMAWVQVELDQKQEAIEHFRQVVELAEDEDLREQAEAAIERLQQ